MNRKKQFVIIFLIFITSILLAEETKSQTIFKSEGSGYIPAIAFSPDGKYIAISGGGRIFLYNIQSGISEKKIESEGSGYIPAIAFSSDGKFISISGGGKVFLYNLIK